eukprot:7971740-Ditylum_brightwellii.AAC.1
MEYSTKSVCNCSAEEQQTALTKISGHPNWLQLYGLLAITYRSPEAHISIQKWRRQSLLSLTNK